MNNIARKLINPKTINGVKKLPKFESQVTLTRSRERIGSVILKNNASSKALYRLMEAMMKAGFVHRTSSNLKVIWKAKLKKGGKEMKSMVIVRRPVS